MAQEMHPLESTLAAIESALMGTKRALGVSSDESLATTEPFIIAEVDSALDGAEFPAVWPHRRSNGRFDQGRAKGVTVEVKSKNFSGVTWRGEGSPYQSCGGWKAHIDAGEKNEALLGFFASETEAARKYDEHAVLLGQALNFPSAVTFGPPAREAEREDCPPIVLQLIRRADSDYDVLSQKGEGIDGRGGALNAAFSRGKAERLALHSDSNTKKRRFGLGARDFIFCADGMRGS